MKASILLAAPAALALATVSPAANLPSVSVKGAPSRQHTAAPVPGLVTLWDQSKVPSGAFGIDSQNFESTFDAYDDAAADDFKVPAGHSWVIKEVDANGVYFNGSGPAVSFDVVFYNKKQGLPAVPLYFCHSQGYVDLGSGYPAITLSGCLKGDNQTAAPAVRLYGGTTGKNIAVSVVANMDFGSGGEWAWNTHSIVKLSRSGWENPGNGFATPCTSWGYTTDCVPNGEGPDFAFLLKGIGD